MNPADYTDATVRTIRRNAGLMPAQALADQLGWSLPRLQRVAQQHYIDLAVLAPGEVAPERARSGRHPAPPETLRNRHLQLYLRRSDYELLHRAAALRGLAPSRLAAEIIRGIVVSPHCDTLIETLRSPVGGDPA